MKSMNKIHNFALHTVHACKDAKQILERYELGSYPDWCNYVVADSYMVVFVWDTRQVIAVKKTGILPCAELDKVPACKDNRKPLVDPDNLLVDDCKRLQLDVTVCPFKLVLKNLGLSALQRAAGERNTARLMRGKDTVGFTTKYGALFVHVNDDNGSFSNKKISNELSYEDQSDWVVEHWSDIAKLNLHTVTY